MAASYFRKKTTITNDNLLSVAYPDMFIGQKPSITLQGGTDINRLLIEAPIAKNPPYGDAELVRCALHLKMSNLETYNATLQPKVKWYKVKKNLSDLDNTEGYLDFKYSGENTTRDNPIVTTAFPSMASFFTESFNGNPDINQSNVETLGIISGSITRTSDYAITVSNMISFLGQENVDGGEGWINVAEYSDSMDEHVEAGNSHLREWFIANYATTITSATGKKKDTYDKKAVYASMSANTGQLTQDSLNSWVIEGEEYNSSATGWIIPMKKGEHCWEFDEYYPSDVRNAASAWWVKASTLEKKDYLETNLEYVQNVELKREAGIGYDLNENNSIFNKIRKQSAFMIPKDGGAPDEAELISIGDINFATNNVLSGGQNCRMRTLWNYNQYDDQTTCSPPLAADAGKTERQEIFMSYGPLPRPGQGNMTGEPTKGINIRQANTADDQAIDNNANLAAWRDAQPLEIVFDVYFENMSPAWIETPHQQDINLTCSAAGGNADTNFVSTTNPAAFMTATSKTNPKETSLTTKSFYFESSEIVVTEAEVAGLQAATEAFQLGTATPSYTFQNRRTTAQDADGHAAQIHPWDGESLPLESNTSGWVAANNKVTVDVNGDFTGAISADDNLAIRINRTKNDAIVTSRRGFFVTLGTEQPIDSHTFADYCTSSMATVRSNKKNSRYDVDNDNGNGGTSSSINLPHTSTNQPGSPLYVLGFMNFAGAKGISSSVRPDRAGKINVVWMGGNYGVQEGTASSSQTATLQETSNIGNFGKHRNCWGASNRTRPVHGGTDKMMRTQSWGGTSAKRESSRVSDIRWYNLHKPTQPDSDVVTLDTEKWYKVRMFIKAGANIISARIEEQDGTMVSTKDIDMGPSWATDAEAKASWQIHNDHDDNFFGDQQDIKDVTEKQHYPKYLTFWNNNQKWNTDADGTEERSTIDVLTGNSDADISSSTGTSLYIDEVEVRGGGWTKKYGTVSKRMGRLKKSPLPTHNKEPIVVTSWDGTVNRPSTQEQVQKPITMCFGLDNAWEVPYYVKGSQLRQGATSLNANPDITAFTGTYTFNTGVIGHRPNATDAFSNALAAGLALTTTAATPYASPDSSGNIHPGSINAVGLADFCTATKHSVLTNGFFKGAIIRWTSINAGTLAAPSEAGTKWFTKGAWSPITDYNAALGDIYFSKVYDKDGTEITVDVADPDWQSAGSSDAINGTFHNFDIINPCYMMFNGFTTQDYANTTELTGTISGKYTNLANTKGVVGANGDSGTFPVTTWNSASGELVGGDRPLTLVPLIEGIAVASTVDLDYDDTAIPLNMLLTTAQRDAILNQYIAMMWVDNSSSTTNITRGRWEIMKITGGTLPTNGDPTTLTVTRGQYGTGTGGQGTATTPRLMTQTIKRVTGVWHNPHQVHGTVDAVKIACTDSLGPLDGTAVTTHAHTTTGLVDGFDYIDGVNAISKEAGGHIECWKADDTDGTTGEGVIRVDWRVPNAVDYVDATGKHLFAWVRLKVDANGVANLNGVNNESTLLTVYVTGRDVEDNKPTNTTTSNTYPDDYAWKKEITKGELLDAKTTWDTTGYYNTRWYLVCVSLDVDSNTVGANAPDRTKIQAVTFKLETEVEANDGTDGDPSLLIYDLWLEGSKRPKVTANFSDNHALLGLPTRQDYMPYPDKYESASDYYRSATETDISKAVSGLTVGGTENEVCITGPPGSVDGFTHKGWVRWDFDPTGDRAFRNTSNSVGHAAKSVQHRVAGFVGGAEGYDNTANQLVGSYFTRRENIYASSPILSLESKGTSPDGSKMGVYVKVAQPDVLWNTNPDTKFIIFKQSADGNVIGGNSIAANSIRNVTIDKSFISGDEVFLQLPKDNTVANYKPEVESDTIVDSLLTEESISTGKIYIGPWCWWLNLQFMGDNDMAKRHYKSVAITKSPYDNEMPVGFESIGWSTSGTLANLSSDTQTATFIGVGPTLNEFQYTDSLSLKRWSMDNDVMRPTFEKGKDYGFGAATTEEPSAGHCSQFFIDPETSSREVWHEANLATTYQVENLKPGDKITLMSMMGDEAADVKFDVNSSEATTDVPYLTTVFADEQPQLLEDFKILPKKDDKSPESPYFTWKSNDDDLWYGMLFVSDGLVTDQYFKSVAHIPMNEEPNISGTTTTSNLKLYRYDQTDGSEDTGDSAHAASTYALNLSATEAGTAPAADWDGDANAAATGGYTNNIEGLAGYSKKFVNNTDCIQWGGTASPYTETSSNTEFTVSVHIVPSAISSPDVRYIMYQQNKFGIYLDANNKVNAYIHGSTAGKYVRLTSTTSVACDGETPTHIALTVDTVIDSSNVKLYVNGDLNVKSGRLDSTGTTQKWKTSDTVPQSAKPLAVGNAMIPEFTASGGDTTSVLDNNELVSAFLPVDAATNDFFNGGIIQFNADDGVTANRGKCRYVTDSSYTSSGTVTDLTIGQAVNTVTSSSKASYLSPYAFYGSIEEITIYNKCIYVTSPLRGNFTLDKHLPELSTNEYSSSLTYECKMFVKDYHNIRGRGKDVTSTRSLPLKRAAFRLNTT